MKHVLEVCIDSLQSAMAAQKGGATRLELCANLVIGGTTPGFALFEAVKKHSPLPVHVLLRPRFGDFLYTEEEFRQIKAEAAYFLENGASAVVSGFLQADGSLDVPRIQSLVELAHSHGKTFTLHRAFDVCQSPEKALRECEQIGVDTILTSGQANTCLEGQALLKQLLNTARGVEILIGAGANAQVIRRLKKSIPAACSFHMSGKEVLQSAMIFRKEGVSMGLPSMSEFEIWRTREEAVRKAWEALTEQ